MDCLFFRHGIAIEREEWTGAERRRPLTDKGRLRTRQSGKGLLAMRLAPTHILSSPLTRSRQTAIILQALLEKPIRIRITATLEPGADPQALCSLLTTLPSDAVVWCIGHGSGRPEGGRRRKRKENGPHGTGREMARQVQFEGLDLGKKMIDNLLE